MPTETRKPLDTGLGSAMDEAVPLYPTEATTPAYAAACLPDRLRCYAATLVFSGHHEQGEFTTLVREAANKLEAADALLSLSARYRAAHAAHVEAVAAENAAYKANVKAPIAATDAARSVMESAKQALLSAVIT